MRLMALLLLLGSIAAAQSPSLPKPQGPVVEDTSKTVNAVFRIQGCTRDLEDKVVCSVQIQSNAQTNQMVSVPHAGVRAITARGFSYPGYLMVEGGQIEASHSAFALPAGGRAAGRLVFPEIPKEESFIAVLFLGGLEFRGLPIGQAPPPSAPAQGQAQPQGSGAVDYRRFVVGPFTFELVEVRPECCSSYLRLTYKVTASQDALLEMRFDKTRTILEGGLQGTGGGWEVSGGRADFIAGLPLNVYVSLYVPGGGLESPQILYTEFEVSPDGGETFEKVVLRNIPIR
ncbi:MAG: hypothetical protein ACUVQD_00570 [Thermaceae bacterium]